MILAIVLTIFWLAILAMLVTVRVIVGAPPQSSEARGGFAALCVLLVALMPIIAMAWAGRHG